MNLIVLSIKCWSSISSESQLWSSRLLAPSHSETFLWIDEAESIAVRLKTSTRRTVIKKMSQWIRYWQIIDIKINTQGFGMRGERGMGRGTNIYWVPHGSDRRNSFIFGGPVGNFVFFYSLWAVLYPDSHPTPFVKGVESNLGIRAWRAFEYQHSLSSFHSSVCWWVECWEMLPNLFQGTRE